MKLTIKNKILFAFSGLILISLLFQVIFYTFFANNLYMDYKEDLMLQAFYDIEENFDGTYESVTDVTSNIENNESIRVQLANNNKTIYSTEQKYYSFDSQFKPKFILTYSGHDYLDTPTVFEFPEGGSETSKTYLVGRFSYYEEDIFVSMEVPTASIQSAASYFSRVSIWISLLLALIGVFLSLSISKSITKPIEDIEKISVDLASLNFSKFANEDMKIIEVNSLAKSINSMSKKLNENIINLNLANKKLKEESEYQKKLENMRRVFVANVSHEMKTPLSILSMYSQNLKEDIKGIDKEFYYDTIIEEVQRIDKMVKDLLDMSNLENGLSKLNIEEFNFSLVILHEIQKLAPLLNDFNLITNIEEDIIIKADKTYISQGINNYITNAITHTKKNDAIQISLYKKDNKVVFSVYNDGENIPQEDLNFVWDSFFKSDKSRTRKDGTNVGLGLYIVKTIIENHYGEYSVQNKENGVEFIFSIPL